MWKRLMVNMAELHWTEMEPYNSKLTETLILRGAVSSIPACLMNDMFTDRFSHTKWGIQPLANLVSYYFIILNRRDTSRQHVHYSLIYSIILYFWEITFRAEKDASKLAQTGTPPPRRSPHEWLQRVGSRIWTWSVRQAIVFSSCCSLNSHLFKQQEVQ